MLIKNIQHIYKKKRFWAGILLAQFLLFYCFSKSKLIISFFESFFDFQKGFHQLLFGWLPFSAGDIIYILLGISLLYCSITLFKKKSRNTSIIRLLLIINIFYFTYQIFWGMLYFQTPIIKKLSSQDNPDMGKAK
ncbi:DUF3810 family protein, partial [Chryseobacterium artocarpi]|uniref:DUF3810 family protein n=1 Tax=Chryseobacterium artocarpi TaxID=1414727 RepID=UPI003F2FB13F